MRAGLALALLLALASTARTQNTPALVTGGAGNVTIGGKPAARQGDTAGDQIIIGGSPNVMINGRPAATTGSQTGCGGTITTGAPNVFINGKPMATSGSAVTPCPR